MSVKLAQLPGPALIAHLALGPCCSTHQQGQVTQDLPPLGLVLGEQTVTPRASLLLVLTLDLDGVLYPPCATRYAYNHLVQHFWCLCQPKVPSPVLLAHQCQHPPPSPSHRFGFPLLESEVHQGQHCRAAECRQGLALALVRRDVKVRCQELCVSLVLGFMGGLYPHHSLFHVLGLHDVFLDKPVVTDKPCWAGTILFHVQEKGCEEEQSWRRWVCLVHCASLPGQCQPRAKAAVASPLPSPLVVSMAPWWGCREVWVAEEGPVLLSSQPARSTQCSQGFPCQCCVPRGRTALSAGFLSRAPGKEAGLHSLCRPGPALRIPAKSSSRRHVHFGESRPAVSHREHLFLATVLAECSPAGTAFPVPLHTTVPSNSTSCQLLQCPLCTLLPASLPALALHLSLKILSAGCSPRMGMEICLVALIC